MFQYREASHLSGTTDYIPDMDVSASSLKAYVITSPYARAKLVRCDLSRIKSAPGVQAVLTAEDIPGTNQMGIVASDEPCLMPTGTVCGYLGQAVCLIAARTLEMAKNAASLIEWEWEELDPVLTLKEAMDKKNFLFDPLILTRGNPAKAMQEAPFQAEGMLSTGGQEHVYFETQSAYAVPLCQGGLFIRSSTQNPTDNQRIVSQILSLPASMIEIEAGCLGGGFGGKQSQGSWTAAWASLLAWKTGKPVLMILDREQDMCLSGKRHPAEARWKVGFNKEGKILAYEVSMAFDCGWCEDVSSAVLHHCLFHADSAYFLPALSATMYACRTNKTSSTAFRGFGVPQAAAVIESAITAISRVLKKDPAVIRRKNYYGIKKNNTTPCNMTVEHNILRSAHSQVIKNSDYKKLRKETVEFNRKHAFTKRGLALVPVKFGISFNESFLNQAGALINVYKDGSVLLHHAGTEMGQGLHDKMRIVVHRELGVPLEHIRVYNTTTSVIPNTTSTAASTGTDFGGAALKDACDKLKKRLSPFALELMGLKKGTLCWNNNQITCTETDQFISFISLVNHAYMVCESLSEKGFYTRKNIGFDLKTMEGRPYWYYVMGTSVACVELDLLTGTHRIMDVWIVHDCGKTIDRGIDLGQIHGAFMQGTGWCTLEQLITDNKGRLLTDSLDNYKIPGIYDIPDNYHIALYQGNPEPLNIQNSRAIGEPPLIYGLSVWLALQDARGTSLPIPATKEMLIKPMYNE